MQYQRDYYKSSKHHIKEIRTAVLYPTSGVVTIIYIWDYITNNNKYFSVDGAITFVCREENGKWKIVHYHGSFDQER